ncbi:C10 family peptidase [Bacteroides sp.]|uniref:C10 family peptidase n=1 Tax=Bacteroides sp. TaxID=29523 RepID=UPI002623B4FA|nr:C10 family peptidase [Bacteroides sp.]MDD3036399.1 C10 family peptidase [Bacteroides sp.]
MKKIMTILLFIQMLLFSQSLFAAPIDDKTAFEIANKFLFDDNKKIFREYEHQLLTSSQLFVINYSLKGQSKGFIVIANEDSMPSPVLAFSKEGKMDLNNGTMQSILKQYSKEITEWRRGKTQSAAEERVYYQKKKSSCPPLLKKVLWHQYFPYNQSVPKDADGKRSLVGCTAITMAQIMGYYQYPTQGTGNATYTKPTKKGKAFTATVNYDSLFINWKAIADRYEPEDSVAALTTICPLLYHCAVGAEMIFGSDTSTGFTIPASNAFFKYFDYHPGIRHLAKHRLTDRQLQQLLYREIEAGRPVMCCGHQHFFVCDGFIDDFFHFDWGWKGSMNGYFKLSALNPDNGNFQMMTHLTVNIRPKNSEEHPKTVNLTEPGTLQQFISENEALTLTSLTITGKLNAKDFRLLRKMAGATETIWENSGELRVLDLSKAEIVADYENYYYRRDLRKENWIRPFNGKETPDGQPKVFKFASMDDKEWELFCQLGGNIDRWGVWKYVKEKNDYFLQYHTASNTISENLFINCVNLKKILLPEKTSSIGVYAFMNCRSLQSMQIPSQTKDINSKVWLDCISMKAVTVSPSNPYFADKNGVLYCKDFMTLLYYPPYKTDSIYILPQSTQKLYPYAFNGSLFLKKISLSKDVKKILPFTFSFCPSLRSVELPNGLEQIEPNAFCNCGELSEVNLPVKFQNNKGSIFVQCNQLK